MSFSPFETEAMQREEIRQLRSALASAIAPESIKKVEAERDKLREENELMKRAAAHALGSDDPEPCVGHVEAVAKWAEQLREELKAVRAENAALRRMLKEELVHQDQSENGDGKYLAWKPDGSALMGRFETFDAAIDAAVKAMQEEKP